MVGMVDDAFLATLQPRPAHFAKNGGDCVQRENELGSRKATVAHWTRKMHERFQMVMRSLNRID
jgi:hypothetical protein